MGKLIEDGPRQGCKNFYSAPEFAASLSNRRRLFSFLFPLSEVQAQVSSGACEEMAEIAVLPSPMTPWKGAPLRILITAEKPLDGELSLIAP